MVIIIAIISFLDSRTYASVSEQVATSTPSVARYEVVQSALAAKWTFMLDKTTGEVFQLVTMQNDKSSVWEKMIQFSPGKIYSKPTYQIFTSGLAVKFTFLINTETGETWELQNSTGKDDSYSVWMPFSLDLASSRNVHKRVLPKMLNDIKEGGKNTQQEE